MRHSGLLSLSAALILAAGPARAAVSDPVLTAMQEELSRSVSKLSRAESAPLYYLAYEVTDAADDWLGASLGGLETDVQGSSRYLDTDVRVGSSRLDNTHEIKGRDSWMDSSQRAKVRLPIEGDIPALRAAMWQQTDAAFKAALERFTKVRTNRAVTADEEDRSPDFSQEGAAARHSDVVGSPQLDRRLWRARLRDYSARFKDLPFVFDSGAGLELSRVDRRFVSSEGAALRTGNLYVRLSYRLTSRTADGMDLYRFKAYDVDRLEDLPSDEAVKRDMEQSIAELKSLRDAPLIEPFAGPVILKNRAAAVFFHEIFGHRVEGQRQKKESEGQTFTKKLGQPVVSSFISVYDDPTLERFQGTFLRGAYKYDDEGVPTQRVALVENGLLRNFLMNRMPIAGFPRSNGHGRREPGHATVARMGNTLVEASRTVPYAQLRRMLLDELARQKKPYGLVFDDISGGYTMTGRESVQAFKVQPLLVYKVYADGRPDEVVRGVDIVGTPIAGFMKILAAGDDPAVFNGTCGAESGSVPVSAVSPSLLISEMEVEKVAKSQAKPPILPPPYGDKP
ncbi:MAG: metallopeptidase TldD-related protein [Elusimicrobia bacterium]|nr:metallopeptidase TldD-related protein [Elusimicrobiota bacterium]